MGYSEEGYAGDLDAAAAAALAAGAVGATPQGDPAAPLEPASKGQTERPSGPYTGAAVWWGTSQGTSSSTPLDTDDSYLASPEAGNGNGGGGAAHWLAGGLRRMIGRVLTAIWPGRARSEVAEAGRDPAEILQTRAREAYAIHKLFCDQTTAYVADAFGYEGLNDKSANQQVAFVESHWTRVDGEAAQDLANRGALIVAGLANSNGTGHTAVVTPGPGWRAPDGAFYPNVTNGGSPAVQSDGSRTVAEVWSVRDRANVRYFTPSPNLSSRSG